MRSARSVWPLVIVAGSIAYPLLVYFALPHMSSRLLLLPALALLTLRALGTTELNGNGTATAFLLAGAVLLVLGLLAPVAAVRAYPVAMSLAAASAFGLSLIHGPSLVERLARRATPELPPQAVRYTWWVTLIWCVFLVGNAAVAAVTALWGTLAQWTLWNGLLFYLAAGLLFGGEYTVRRVLNRRLL